MHGTLRFLNLSHLLYGICVNIFIMKSVYFKELHNEQEYYSPTIYKNYIQKMVKKAADRGLIKFSFLEISRTNRFLFRTKFQMESNQNEMKLHFQTSSCSLNISQLCRLHVYSLCFYDPPCFQNYFQNAITEFVQTRP